MLTGGLLSWPPDVIATLADGAFPSANPLSDFRRAGGDLGEFSQS